MCGTWKRWRGQGHETFSSFSTPSVTRKSGEVGGFLGGRVVDGASRDHNSPPNDKVGDKVLKVGITIDLNSS